MHYTLKDHQGNLTATICGNTVERLSYDAWGRRRNPNGFGYGNVTHTFDRGYTLHEHYDDFGLVNMNGRCYDPVTSHFLSVDAYVQQPGNSQGFNRYAYCMYNPLRYTDPTGWLSGTGRSDTPNLNHSHDETARWHSEDINDVLWGRSVHPCETGNPYRVNSTSSEYTQGNESNYRGGTIVTRGGWYRDRDGTIKYDPDVTKDNINEGQQFLGITYVENNLYYSLTGKIISLDVFDGVASALIEEMIQEAIRYQIEENNYVFSLFGSSEPLQKSTDVSKITKYVRDVLGYGVPHDNRIEFSYEESLGYFYQYDPKSEPNKDGIFARFNGVWPTQPSHLQNYGLYGSIPDGYHIYFPKVNSSVCNIYVFILVYPNTTVGKQNYEQYKCKINHTFPSYHP